MDNIDLAKQVSFGLGLAFGLGASTIAIYLLRNSDDKVEILKRENKSTQTEEIKILSKLISHFCKYQKPNFFSDFKTEANGNLFTQQDPVDCILKSPSFRSPSPTNTIISSSTLTAYYDAECNITFFKFFMKAYENLDNIITPRVTRTSQMGCETDDEFKAKVQCLREGFKNIFESETNRMYFKNIGSEILEILSTNAMNPKECLEKYHYLIDFVLSEANVKAIEEELTSRSIPVLSFYDLVLDYMILDSFEDLEDPPPSLINIAQNQWMPVKFKEIAMKTAISTVLKLKRSKLKWKDGFFAIYYDILEQILPVLAWGFLGCNNDLTYKCNLLKSYIHEAIRDYFNFDRIRYTNLEEFTMDLLNATEERFEDLKSKLNIT